MATLTDIPASVTTLEPGLLAGLLLVSQQHLKTLDLPHPTVSQIISAAGAGRSWAYEQRARVHRELPSLQRSVGRPRPEDTTHEVAYHDATDRAVLARAMLEHVMAHPGCVDRRGQRAQYSEGLRRHVLELRRRYAHISAQVFAATINIPLGTLKQWLHLPQHIESLTSTPDEGDVATTVNSTSDDELGSADLDGAKAQPNEETRNASSTDLEPLTAPRTPELLQIETILHAWEHWDGKLGAFVEHLQSHLSIPYGRDTIARTLRQAGALDSKPRAGRSPDELATRGSFKTHFPGAQWVGDGKSVTVTINDMPIVLNLQLTVDVASAAWVGLCVSQTEDSTAVISSYQGAFATVDAGPIAVLLDGHPCNHTDEVANAIAVDGGFVITATPFRPQNKAHCEGAFGLFAQELPPIIISDTTNPQLVAMEVLRLVSTSFARGLNGRPMRKHNDKSRSELYQAQPSDEQIEAAKACLAERLRIQTKARETELARQDPFKRKLLDEAFDELGLVDPHRNIRLAIARYPLDPILEGLSIFRVKQAQNTIPEGSDARYLLGIVRNHAKLSEGTAIAEDLIRERTAAYEALLANAERKRQAIEAQTPELDTLALLLVEAAIDATRKIEQHYWMLAAIDTTRTLPLPERRDLIREVARLVYSSFQLPARDREHLALSFVSGAIPLH